MKKYVYGWTHYKRTGWVINGKKQYEGYFKKDNDPYNFTLVRVRFTAKHPVLAMREIAERLSNGISPYDIGDKEIN